jgi:hypothetical protein
MRVGDIASSTTADFEAAMGIVLIPCGTWQREWK